MQSKLIALTFLVLMLVAPALAAEGEANLCYTTHAGQCNTDEDWQVGWFWANHPPGNSSCDLYQQRFGDDAWNMCGDTNSKGSDDSQTSKSESQRLFELTSQWQAMPEDGSSPCPYEGLDPIMNYEDNTFVCATSF